MPAGNRQADVDSKFEREWRARFEVFGRKHGDDAGIAGWSHTGLGARVRRFTSLWTMKDRSGELWIDAGCGAGTYTRLLEEAGARAIGLDYSLPAVQRAKARGTNAMYLAGDVTRLPMRTASVDGVLCFGVSQATSSTRSVARELLRITKPGGEIWIDGLNCWSLASVASRVKRTLLRKKRHLRYERPGRAAEELRLAGATAVEMHWLPLAPPSAQWLQAIFDHAVTQRILRAVHPVAALLCHSFIVQGRRSDRPVDAAS
jgi:ubiquinone/menaquinone biosynthesis C-methylase UbiE